jgi:hypothetical protein
MTDWPTVIRDLQRAHWTYLMIGAKCGLTTGAVGDLASGRTSAPRYKTGKKLLALHQRICNPIPKIAA